MTDRETDGAMDGQAYESGNQPFLPRASVPSVLRLSIFSGTHGKRGTRRQRERERERKSYQCSTPRTHSRALSRPEACSEELRHAHLHAAGNSEPLPPPRTQRPKDLSVCQNPSKMFPERSLHSNSHWFTKAPSACPPAHAGSQTPREDDLVSK